MEYIKKMMRKRNETTFPEITSFFPSKMHAVTIQGFLLKVVLFIFAYTHDKSIYPQLEFLISPKIQKGADKCSAPFCIPGRLIRQ